jgi:hypothetical protein
LWTIGSLWVTIRELQKSSTHIDVTRLEVDRKHPTPLFD